MSKPALWFRALLEQKKSTLQDFRERRHTGTLPYYTTAVFAIATFAVWCVSWLFWSGPLCCADNVYIAIPPSNFMQGDGYTSSFPRNIYMMAGVNPEDSYSLAFDPGVSTGGPSQIISALLQWAFPDSLYAPDFAGIITRSIILIGIMAWWPNKSLLGATVFAGFLLALTIVAHQSIAVMTTAIGDYTAPLFYIWSALGFYLAIKHNDMRYGIAACILIYLGIITKLNSIAFVLPFCAAVVGYLVFHRKWHWIGAFAVTGLGAVAIQEIVILMSLGSDGYSLNKAALIKFVDRTSTRATFEEGWLNAVDKFYINVPFLTTCFLSLMFVTFSAKTRHVSFFILFSFCATAGLYAVYGISYSAINPRYIIMPSVLVIGGIFLLTSTLVSDLQSFALRPRLRNGLLAALTITVTGLLFSGKNDLWMFKQQDWLPARSYQKEENIRAFQAYLNGLGSAPIYSFSWQSAVVPERLTPEFARVSFTNGRAAIDGYLLSDTRWIPDHLLPEFVATNCTIDFDLTPFRVYACHK